MGGDYGPSVVVPAALRSLSRHPDLHLILVGDKTRLQEALASEQASENPRLTIHHASQQVMMDEEPGLALRNKKDSSMRVAINLVKEGEAQACVSAGNTGALVATARFVLKMIPGISRPAIIAALPSTTEACLSVRMLDLGGNVECTAEHLLQFALIGSTLTSAVEKIEAPSVALLNVGAESIKGNDLVKEAAPLLEAHPDINYVGFVEGDEIYSGNVRVIVCDGFVGNVALKTSEGVAKTLNYFMKRAFNRNLLTRLVAAIARPVLRSGLKSFDPKRYNGASLLGLNGIVIKSHGGADALAYSYAIEEALHEARSNIVKKITHKLTQLANESIAT